LLSLDKCRSVYNYESPIKSLIKHAKYDRKLYILEAFAKEMSFLYFKSYFNADYLCYIPMTEKAFKKRGYNQSEILAKFISERINVEVANVLSKVKETNRQAKLGRADRLKNLEDAFKVTDKKLVKDKTLVIIDDVTTTGATAENVAKKLKNAGAKAVYLLSVASVPPKQGY
jgi:competence protein ComFC